MKVTEIQRFCMHDGPGIRTVVFMKGCPLRCEWCHNPETQSAKQEIMYYQAKCIGCGACAGACPNGCHSFNETPEGAAHRFDRENCITCGKCVDACPAGALENACREMSADEVLGTVIRDRAFYGAEGGVTLSGGEPLMQAEDAISLLRKCKTAGIGTAVETCGFFDRSLVAELAKVTDLLLWDYKDSDGERLRQYTGAPDRRDVDNLIACDAAGIPSVLRCIVVGGVNDGLSRVSGIADLFSRLRHCLYAELLPYHPYGGAKAAALGRTFREFPDGVPSGEALDRIAGELTARGVTVKPVR